MDASTRRVGGDCGGGRKPRRTGSPMRRAFAFALAVMLAAALPQAAAAQSKPGAKPAAKPAAKPGGAFPGVIVTPVPPPGAPGAPGAGELDMAYGAFQRGYFLTAFQLATERVTDKADPKSMTLLGELYAGGLAVARDDAKAAEWYKLAADRGDSN